MPGKSSFDDRGTWFSIQAQTWCRRPTGRTTYDLTYSKSIIVTAPTQKIYAMVSDVTRMGEWSPICKACWWETNEHGVGAWFRGRNETPNRIWETRSLVVTADLSRKFAFVVNGDRVLWSYQIREVPEGTEVTESWQFLAAGIEYFRVHYGDDAEEQIAERTQAARSSIPITLEAIKRGAEEL